MKPRLSKRHEAGLTLFEAVIVVVAVVVLAMLFLPALAKAKRKSSRIGCSVNLKQIGLAYRIWAGDNHDLYPQGVPAAYGGSWEFAERGDAASTFQVMSNELSSIRILVCSGLPGPGDTNHTYATNFNVLSNSNISYFVGVDVTNESNISLILSGDSNLQIDGKAVKPGLISVWTNDPVKWSSVRHGHSGNIGLADGSVQSATDSGLRDRIVETGIATNRWAIP